MVRDMVLSFIVERSVDRGNFSRPAESPRTSPLPIEKHDCLAADGPFAGGRVQVGVDRLRDGSAGSAYKSVSRRRIGYES
jgi:hypothetical protein